MDFIERIFGIAPDGGSGTLEVALFIALVALAALAVIFRSRLRSTRDR